MSARHPIAPVAVCLTALLLFAAPLPASADPPPLDPALAVVNGSHILVGWNDLGMHCSNARFQDLTVLPPFNTVWATLIRRGDPTRLPEVVSTGYRVDYMIEDNTYSVGKTDFWTYAPQIFGVTLPPNVGLYGKGLAGSLDLHPDHFEALGIPLTPYTDSDLVHEQPYQLGVLTAYDAGSGVQVASTEIVVPVSNEMMCSNCHHPNTGETVEHAILRRHDHEEGTNLANSTPVLCADCHASNALGLPGRPGLPSLSDAMHSQHAEETNDCYQCHPGPNTQCLRGTMATDFGLVCQNCHGDVRNVAESIHDGRRPWLDEPRCGDCHGAAYAEPAGVLFRNANNGHGNLYCPTCHNSPHAILPAREERDNRQVVALQGHAGTLSDCSVCHGYTPSGPGPHGVQAVAVPGDGPGGTLTARVLTAPNPFRARTEVTYQVVDESPIRLSIYDASGREVRVLTANPQTPGRHTLVWDGRGSDGGEAPAGVYFARLRSGGEQAVARVVKLGN